MNYTKPTKKQLLTYTGIALVSILALYGLVAGVNYSIAFTNRKLDAYALNRVDNSDALKSHFQGVKTVEVPVIKQSDVANQINSAIQSNLK